MISLVIVVVDEGFDLGFEITRQEVVFQQDAVWSCPGFVPVSFEQCLL